MDCNVTKNNIYSCKTVYENFSEEKIDFDIVIPDYCAAAAKILKCEVQPAVSSKTVNGDRLITEGICTVTVMYADELTGAVKSVTETAPFSQNQALKEQLDVYRIKLKLRVSNVSCRLQNSRRISVKAIVGVASKVMGNVGMSVIDSVDDCDIETLFETAELCTYSGGGETDMRISGEIAVSEQVLDVIKCDGCITVTDVKVIKDKVIIKGEAAVSCLYTVGEMIGDFDSVQSIIPFNEIIDVEGAEENSIGDAECEIVGLRCEIGDMVMNVEIEARAVAGVYNNITVNLLKDAYSKEGAVTVGRAELPIESLADKMNFSETVKSVVEADLADARISDITAKPVIKNITAANGALVIEGDLNVSVYATTGDEYRFSDKSVPFSVTKSFDAGDKNMRCEAGVCAHGITFTVPSDNSLEVRAELVFNILVFSAESYTVIEQITPDESAEGCGLGSKVVLYYAEGGESLWDIAKRYHTSVDIIRRDNELEDAAIKDGKMIIISGN